MCYAPTDHEFHWSTHSVHALKNLSVLQTKLCSLDQWDSVLVGHWKSMTPAMTEEPLSAVDGVAGQPKDPCAVDVMAQRYC